MFGQTSSNGISSLRLVSLPISGRSYPSLRLQKGSSRFRVSCAVCMSIFYLNYRDISILFSIIDSVLAVIPMFICILFELVMLFVKGILVNLK